VRKHIQWSADTDCVACSGKGFKVHRTYVEDSEGYKEIDEVYTVVCACVELEVSAPCVTKEETDVP